MAPSIDGRIVTRHWNVSKALTSEYEKTAQTFKADGWIIGRVSMEPYAGKASIRRRTTQHIPRTDFIAPHSSKSFAIAIDPTGKLRWTKSDIDGEHVITILSEEVPDSYLAFLREKGVSYLFGGRKRIDVEKALEKLARSFGIQTLLLEGGGRINGSFLEAGVIDELSILIAPVADGSMETPTLFDTDGKKGPTRKLKLIAAKKRSGDIVWLRYRVSS